MYSVEDLHELARKKFTFNNIGIANYGWLTVDGNYEPCGTYICHAGLRGRCHVNPTAVVSGIKDNSNLSDEIKRAFYEWMLNRSPLSECYLTKNVEQAFKDKFILLNVDQPGNKMLAAAILHRHVWEEIKVPKVWFDLVNGGMDPDGAFVIAHFVNVGYGPYDNLDKRKVSVNLVSNNSNHTIFDGEIPLGTLTNFKNGMMPRVATGTYKTEGGFGGVGVLFKPLKDTTGLLMRIKPLLKGLNGPTTKTKHNNPFDVASPNMHNEYCYPKLINHLCDIYSEICKEDEKCAAK